MKRRAAAGATPSRRSARLDPAADATPSRRSARLDPAQAAAAARDRERAQEIKRDLRERRALDAALRAEATRIRKLPEIIFDARGTAAAPESLARWAVPPGDVASLRAAQDAIAERVQKMPWAGGSDDADKRWRGYGLPPGARRRLTSWMGDRFHSFETPLDLREGEARRNWASCVDFELKEDVEGAVRRCAATAARALPAHAGELSLQNLVALQPNAHAGNRFLPRHLDWPRHDGFGLIIVTVAVRGRGTVVLEDRAGGLVRFELPEGHAYCLAGAARNAWLHGVVGSDPDRESLNLRFGLHSYERARADVYARWRDAACGAEGPAGDDGRGA